MSRFHLQEGGRILRWSTGVEVIMAEDKFVTCPKCKMVGKEEDFETKIRQGVVVKSTGLLPRGVMIADIGYKCKICGAEFGFEIPDTENIKRISG